MRKSKEPPPALRSIDQTATYMQLSISTVRRLVRRGELPQTRIGSRTLIRQCDIDAFIASAVVAKQS